jgi:hypothetical protein
MNRETVASVMRAPRQPRDRPETARPATVAQMEMSGPDLPIARRETSAFRLLNVATVGFIVAWLAVACYAIAYLIAH